MAEIVHGGTVVLRDRFIDRRSRTHDLMVQAARSGKQNHASGVTEGGVASGTSKKTEPKLMGVARASLEELLLDFQDFLRQHRLGLWGKDHPQAKAVRANALICLIHQTNFLLDRQLWALEKEFLEKGGFTERLYHARSQMRDRGGRP